MPTEKLSLITITMNSETTLGDTLASIKQQRCKDFEHIAIDGASTDRTLEILENKGLPSTKIFSEPDAGIFDACNKGIQKASGSIIGFLHSDDTFNNPSVLEDVRRIFEEEAIDILYGDLAFVRADKRTQTVRSWKAGDFSRRKLMFGWMPPHPTLYVRPEIYEATQGFDTQFKISGDYHSILKIFSMQNTKIRYNPSVMVDMALGGASTDGLASRVKTIREDYRALKMAKVGSPLTVACKRIRKVHQFLSSWRQLHLQLVLPLFRTNI